MAEACAPLADTVRRCLSRLASDGVKSASAVTFEAASPEFDRLHGGSAVLLAAASSDEPLFHEAGVWIPSSSEWLVTSNRLRPGTPETYVQVLAIHHPSGAVRRLASLEQQIIMANGGTTDGAGGAYLASQGLGAVSGSLWHIDASLSVATRVGPPEGLVLNSVNDIVHHRASDSLLFSDPAYGVEVQGFRETFNASKAVWSCPALSGERHADCASWHLLSECAAQPNGVLLSPNGQTAYVSDVWSGKWHQNGAVRLSQTAGAGSERSRVMAYDVVHHEGGSADAPPLSLTNARVLIDLSEEDGARGYPDGLKCDQLGNLYTGCGGGVRVYRPDGTFLGLIAVEGGVANLCFGGRDGRTLLILNEARAFAVQMNVCGALGSI